MDNINALDSYLESFSENYIALMEEAQQQTFIQKLIAIFTKIKEFLAKAIHAAISKVREIFINDKNLISKADELIKKNADLKHPIELEYPNKYNMQMRMTKNLFKPNGLNPKLLNRDGTLKYGRSTLYKILVSDINFDEFYNKDNKELAIKIHKEVIKDIQGIRKIRQDYADLENSMNNIERFEKDRVDAIDKIIASAKSMNFSNDGSDDTKINYRDSIIIAADVYRQAIMDMTKASMFIFKEMFKAIRAALIKCVAGASIKREGTVDRIVKLALLECESCFI